MRLLGRLTCAVAAAAVAAVAAAYLLPREVAVTRQVVVDAAPERVFQHVNSLQRMAEWSPWIDPGTARSYTGPKRGVGGRMQWTTADGRARSGSQEIVASVANREVETSLELGAGEATAWLKLEPADGGTRVTWGLLAEMGDTPTRRYRGLLLSRRVAARYEEGLRRLKALIEAE
jgi:hypothetical protein